MQSTLQQALLKPDDVIAEAVGQSDATFSFLRKVTFPPHQDKKQRAEKDPRKIKFSFREA